MQSNSISKESSTFWRDKRVIVTGGAGFLGSYVVQKLHQRGVAEVIAPRHADYDLRDLTAIRQLLCDTNHSTNRSSIPTTYSNGSNGHHNTPHSAPPTPHSVDLVIHLAAHVGGIEANRTHPAEFFYDNLMMGVQLLHESWRAGVAKFVAIGTICAYPKFASIPFREEELWHGYREEINAPYGLAKKMMLVQSQSYRQQYGYNSIYLLPVNLYGPGDNLDLTTSHVIPALIRKCVEANASTSSAAGATSSAAGAAHSVRDFLDEAFGYVGLDWQDYVRIDPRYYRPTEVDYLLADAGQAERHLGWKPKVTFRELVRIMVDADLETLGVACPGEGMRLLPARFNGWHRWESSRRAMAV